MLNFLQYFRVDPVNLIIKEKLSSMVFCFIAILGVASATDILVDNSAYPILVASMGASAVILFIIPGSPLAQPWSFVGGQFFSCLIGITFAQMMLETSVAAASAVGASVFIMFLLRCLHPPGAATALAPVLAGEPLTSLGFYFILFPVVINVALMLLMAIVINRWIMKREYPIYVFAKKSVKKIKKQLADALYPNISEDDLNVALNKSDTFIDVTSAEIRKLLFLTEQHGFKRSHKVITCADIMEKEVMKVEYGTDVEEAWDMMYKRGLKAMPVTDKANRVIGIVTWNDFFKSLNLRAYATFQDKFREFICRTRRITTDKPESIGHLMTKSVTVMSEDTNIIELVPFMTSSGLKQIPIVNKDERLVGMVFQNQLIGGLYNQKRF